MEKYELLVIKDSEFTSAGKKFKAYCNVLEDVILQYKTTLNDIGARAISSGATHDALLKYIEYIAKLEIIARGTGEKCNSLVNSFIAEVERADDYLYDAGISDSIRDFSSEEYNRLVECLDDPWCSITDSIGDWFYEKINKIIDFFNWDSAKSFLQKCHRLLLDYNDETKQGLTILFDRVHEVDRNYGSSNAGAVPGDGDYYTCYFACVVLTMCQIRDMLDIMSDIINPRNGMFTVDNIDDKLGKAYETLLSYYEQTVNIKELGQKPTVSEISDFASQPWSNQYFSCFFWPMSDFIADMGGYEAFKMVVFNMFEIAGDRLLIGDYEEYMAKKQLLAVLEDMAQDYKFSESDEKEAIDDCNTFLKYVKKYGDNWYEYMNTTRGENGKLLLDGRTKEAKEFNRFLKGLGGAQKILKYGSQGIEFVSQLFADYEEGLQILDSFEKNYSGDQTILNAVSQIRELYNKEFDAWAFKAVQEVEEIGIDVGLKKLGKAIPVVAVVSAIGEGIDLVGDLAGVGSESQSMYDALVYYQLYDSSQAAYNNALAAFKVADPNSEEYQVLAQDVENCFNLHKKNIVEVFNAMSKASNGTKQSYYHYCAKQAETLTMHDGTQPDILSYDEFLSLNT